MEGFLLTFFAGKIMLFVIPSCPEFIHIENIK